MNMNQLSYDNIYDILSFAPEYGFLVSRDLHERSLKQRPSFYCDTPRFLIYIGLSSVLNIHSAFKILDNCVMYHRYPQKIVDALGPKKYDEYISSSLMLSAIFAGSYVPEYLDQSLADHHKQDIKRYILDSRRFCYSMNDPEGYDLFDDPDRLRDIIEESDINQRFDSVEDNMISHLPYEESIEFIKKNKMLYFREIYGNDRGYYKIFPKYNDIDISSIFRHHDDVYYSVDQMKSFLCYYPEFNVDLVNEEYSLICSYLAALRLRRITITEVQDQLKRSKCLKEILLSCDRQSFIAISNLIKYHDVDDIINDIFNDIIKYYNINSSVIIKFVVDLWRPEIMTLDKISLDPHAIAYSISRSYHARILFDYAAIFDNYHNPWSWYYYSILGNNNENIKGRLETNNSFDELQMVLTDCYKILRSLSSEPIIEVHHKDKTSLINDIMVYHDHIMIECFKIADIKHKECGCKY